jgi:hypothetical protein
VPTKALVISSVSHTFRLFDATSASRSQLCRLSHRTPGRPWSHEKSTSLELLCPSASPDSSALLITTPADVASENHCPGPRKSHPQGLATLAVVSAPLESLGILFQFPTLLGFALQSFSPLPGSEYSLEYSCRSGALLQNPHGPCTSAPAGSTPGKSRAPLYSAPKD